MANDGVEALDLFATLKPRVVLMDLRMPRMDGLEALRRLKETEAGAETPVIIVSASALVEQKQEAHEAGADGFLRKPFLESELMEMLSEIVGVRMEDRSSLPPEADMQPVTTDRLAALGAEIGSRLRDALLTCDVDTMHALTRDLADTDEPLARALNTMIGAYRYEALLNLLPDEWAR